MTDKFVEIVKKALHNSKLQPVILSGIPTEENFHHHAIIAISAIEASGYVIVPRVPTKSMIDAAQMEHEYWEEVSPKDVYERMLAASTLVLE